MLGWLKNRRKRFTFKIDVQRSKWGEVRNVIDHHAKAHDLLIYYAVLSGSATDSLTVTVSIQICGRSKDVDQFRIWLATFWTSPWARLKVA